MWGCLMSFFGRRNSARKEMMMTIGIWQLFLCRSPPSFHRHHSPYLYREINAEWRVISHISYTRGEKQYFDTFIDHCAAIKCTMASWKFTISSLRSIWDDCEKNISRKVASCETISDNLRRIFLTIIFRILRRIFGRTWIKNWTIYESKEKLCCKCWL